MNSGIEIAIDRGGTFCDVIAKIPDQPDFVFKLLSVDPKNYRDAPTEGIRRVLERAQCRKIPKTEKLKLDNIKSIRMGTTVATNALLERKGANVCLITTKGFGDILSIGTQARPQIFDLAAKKLDHLYKTVIEIDERITIEGFTEGNNCDSAKPMNDDLLKIGETGDLVRVLKKPNYLEIEKRLLALYEEGQVTCIALCLLHSYIFPEHESKIAEICRKIGFEVSVSHELQPMIGMVKRASSTVADAYLTPVIKEYLSSFGSGFDGGLGAFGNKLLFMQSNGGLCPWYKFTGLKAILSGPAGGMVGYGKTCYDSKSMKATIGFDAGGTSTDVSRYAGGLNHIFESVVSEVSLQTPQLDISTVAAGGGSMLFWKNGMFVVGPESAGSDPGPACYRKGGPLTVTDANLYLGRLLPEYFPKIFGLNQDQELDYEITAKKFKNLTKIINKEKESEGVILTPEEVASGFLKVAVESMCRPIRALTEAKGFSTQDHNLACFGGSGGQFSVSLCKNLGISQVAIHKYSSLLSAYGIHLADIIIEKQSPSSWVFEEKYFKEIDNKIQDLVKQVHEDCSEQNLNSYSNKLEVYLNMKYVGTDTHLLIPKSEGKYDCAKDFIQRHEKEFGFTLDRNIIVDDIQVLLIIQRSESKSINPFQEYTHKTIAAAVEATPVKSEKIYFENLGWLESSVYNLNNLNLNIGQVIRGPAIIIDDTQTILIEPKSTAVSLKEHILINVGKETETDLSSDRVDPIQLSVFSHRFMSIAEQMGKTLQQTAISTNIKERLDFSCAIFDNNGDLVANAPHVPIHLGAMSFAVKAQMKMWKGKLKQGDVLVSNHPIAGGSHLPDITVITPVLDDNDNPIFWTASRGHHADIGSISAGSMPPNSKTIHEEGAAIVTHKLCVEGRFDEEGISEILMEKPSGIPGCSGSRALQDNISDLKAQVAANYKGITLLNNLIIDFKYPVVSLYMKAIQSTASISVRNLLKNTHSRFNGKVLHAIDHLDDGTQISVQITINPDTGDSVFDFTESGNEIYGNLNAPNAILYSAILYVLRSLVSDDIPLNNGCLEPITVLTREGSVINPTPEAGVVGGNVETSQRIVDVLLKAFEAVAASQGTCNNFTFGINDAKSNTSFGYYETICGGSGAGPSWDGQSAVQCHTTNTRMTDVEIFEKRYPVILREFSIRRGSGGKGSHKGGDGIIRDIEFTMSNLEVSCLMERRSIAPFGLLGGEDGSRGLNFWLRKPRNADSEQYHRVSLGGKCTLKVQTGDRIVIMTPGGGGYGKLSNN